VRSFFVNAALHKRYEDSFYPGRVSICCHFRSCCHVGSVSVIQCLIFFVKSFFLMVSSFFPADEQIPWVGAGIGIIIGVSIIIADQLIPQNPTISVTIPSIEFTFII